MTKEILPINDLIPKVKTKYHECNKCEHESSNCKNNIGLPQELILQDHLKYIIIAFDDFSINVIILYMLYIVVWI
jgi:hypothetical protein